MQRPFFAVFAAMLIALISSAWSQQNKSSEGGQKSANKKSWKEATIQLTDGSFEREVISSKAPILVEFWAEWAGPSRALSPTLEAVLNKYDGKLRFGRVNVDKCPAICQKLDVQSIPLVVIFKDGRERERETGPQNKERYEQMIDRQLQSK